MKIVILCQHIFPMQSPRAFRATELVKEFARQKHEVTVYAVLGEYDYSDFENEFNCHVKPIPIRWQYHSYNSDGDGKRFLVDKVFGRLLGRLLEFPYLEFVYKIPKILKLESRADLIISIADPHHIHWGVARAMRKNPQLAAQATWIADCGDPFMNNDQTDDHRSHFAKFERDFCELANAITVPFAEAKNGYYQEYRHKIEVIPQGIKFEEIRIEKPAKKPSPIPKFAYGGMLNRNYRNPHMLLEYLTQLDRDFEFHVYSRESDLVEELANQDKRVILHDLISRKKFLEKLLDMDFVLNIENLNLPNQLPSKLIDYSLSGLPILSINPGEIHTNLIDQFMEGDYSGQMKIEDIDRYRIENVCRAFMQLTEKIQST